jgi:hypothetical protein
VRMCNFVWCVLCFVPLLTADLRSSDCLPLLAGQVL